MRKLLLLALLLYNIVLYAMGSSHYDYDDIDLNKRHSQLDDRRSWRKKVLLNNGDMENKDYDSRKRYDYDNPTRFLDESDQKLFGGVDRHRDTDAVSYRKRYDDMEKMVALKSAESIHSFTDDKKTVMNCDRPHERYETCFAGCAAISCDNPRERLRPCYPFCEAGCICVPPYVRDDRTHKCVLADECTKGLRGIPDIGEELL